MYFKARRIKKLGDDLKNKLVKKHLWYSVKSGQAINAFKKLSEKRPELKRTRLVSYRDGILKIQVSSGIQRQEIFFKKEEIVREMGVKGIEVREIKVSFN